MTTPSFVPRTPPIYLPGIDGGVQATEAYGWLKLVASKAPKTSKAGQFYQRWAATMAKLGIPKSKWNSVWKDAVDWTQTPGSGSTGYTEEYLSLIDPSEYIPAGSTKKYGTTKNKTVATTQYSPSNAADYLSKTFEQEIGRTATKAEIDAYIKGVNAAAAKEPATTTTTTNTQPGKGGILETSTSTVTQTTGFDPAIYAQNFARSRPDFAESFATKNFLKIIEGLLQDRNAIGTVVE